MIVLADYNLNRQAILISGSLLAGGWLDLAPIRLATFESLGLPADSNDRVVWRFAQANGMLLLTANRNAKGEDSLEQVMREENQPTSFPIITIGEPLVRVWWQSNFWLMLVSRRRRILMLYINLGSALFYRFRSCFASND